MAKASSLTTENYLDAEYRPDVEYLDGVPKPKTESGFRHGEAECLLGIWFTQYKQDWAIRCALNTRIRINSSRVRLIDVVVVSREVRERKELTVAPLVAIEILDNIDFYTDLKSRAADLQAMGVRNIWLVDPEMRTGEVWQHGSWLPKRTGRLQAVDSAIYLDLDWLWQRMDED